MMLRLRLHGGFALTGSDGAALSVPSQKGRALLAILARPLARARSREEIMALLWSDRSEAQGRASLRQTLANLRRDLGEESRDAIQVEGEMLSLDPAMITLESAPSGGVLLADLTLRDPAFDEWLRDERLAEEGERDPQDAAEVNKASIAVLPFANLGGDPEQEYFSDGITQDIITELSRFQSLFVIAGDSSFAFKETQTDPIEIGRHLQVQFLLKGSVRRGGDRLRVTVQLIDAATGATRWSERYDRDITDLFAVQDDIAAIVATMVSGHLDMANLARADRKHPRDINAHDLFLKAEMLSYDDYVSLEARELLLRVINLDPTYADAHAKLAAIHAYSVFTEAKSIDIVLPRVLHHGKEAARHAPGDALVHGPLAEAYSLVGEHAAAAYHAERALAINPHSFNVMVHCAEALALLGKPDEALSLVERAYLRDPFNSFSFRENSFDVFFMAERYDAALDQMIAWPNAPIHMKLSLAAALALLGRVEEARAAVQDFEILRPEGWSVTNVVESYRRMCARPEDGARWVKGFRLAGVIE